MKAKCVGTAAVGTLLVATIFLAGCSEKKQSAAPVPEVVRDVAVLELRPTSLPDTVEAVGTVRASESAPVAAQIMGNVLAVNVREGDRVRRGQVLVVIDDAQSRAGTERAQAAVSGAEHEAAAAEAEYTLASATMKRYQDLLEKKAVSPQEFDEVKARMQAATARREQTHAGQAQARAALAQSRTMLDYTRIRAPFDGVVTDKRVDPGAMATPGMPLLTVETAGRYRLEATVDESNLRFVKLGENVNVRIDAAGDTAMTGRVAQIVPAADPGSRSFVVKVELPANPQLRSGLFGRAFFSRGERESLVIPRAALVSRGQLQGVYVVGPDQIATLRYVTVGKSGGEQFEVLSGLQAGDRVVTAPGASDLGGKKIQ